MILESKFQNHKSKLEYETKKNKREVTGRLN